MNGFSEIPEIELREITGGEWVDTAWGFMLTAAFTAGFIGSGGMLAVAAGAGGLILLDGWAF